MHIHTSVREDSITLFGFTEVQDRDIFLSLTTVKGIGPKLAMAVMGGMAVTDIISAVASRDVKSLTKVSGLGKKTAERIIVELRERFEALLPGLPLTNNAGSAVAATGAHREDVKSALMNLGFKATHVDRALSDVLEEPDAPNDFDGLFRDALKRLR